MPLAPRQVVQLVLAAVALLALAGAAVTVAMAPPSTEVLLVAFLGVLVAVLVAEIVLLVADRRQASRAGEAALSDADDLHAR